MSRRLDASSFWRYGATFAELLPELRREAGLTQEQLAQRTGRPQSFISKIETKERNVSLDDFPMIVRALDLDAARVFGRIHRAVLRHVRTYQKVRAAR